MEARDPPDDIRGCAGGIRERLEAEADGMGPGDGAGRATGRFPADGPAGRVVAPPPPPGGLAMGCSGRTGWPGRWGCSGGTTM